MQISSASACTTMAMASSLPQRGGKLAFLLLSWTACLLSVTANEGYAEGEEEIHPDPNEEDYSGMIYVGRMNDEGRRAGFEVDNGETGCCTAHCKRFSLTVRTHLRHPPRVPRRGQVHLRHRVRRDAQGHRGEGPAPLALRAGLRPRRAGPGARQDAGAGAAREADRGTGSVQGAKAVRVVR